MIGRPRKLTDADVRWLHENSGALSKSAMARRLGVHRRLVQRRLTEPYKQAARA